MQMKRIFIAIQYMELGGAERALLGLLDALDASRFQVDLFVYRHSGELMPLIPDKVNLLPELPSYRALSRPVKDILKEGRLGIAAARLWAKRRSARFGNGWKAVKTTPSLTMPPPPSPRFFLP